MMQLAFNSKTDAIDAATVIENLSAGVRLGDAFGIDGQQLEAVYTLASGQYQHGRYVEALKLFSFITLHDQTFMKAFKGIGSCLQMIGRYQEALVYLGLAIIDDDGDLQTAVQIAECLLHVGQKDDALSILKRISGNLSSTVGNEYTRNKVDGLLALMSAEAKSIADDSVEIV